MTQLQHPREQFFFKYRRVYFPSLEMGFTRMILVRKTNKKTMRCAKNDRHEEQFADACFPPRTIGRTLQKKSKAEQHTQCLEYYFTKATSYSYSLLALKKVTALVMS